MADKESGTSMSAKDLKRKKRIKLAIYITIFVVFQVIVITVFSLTVLKVKTPKFRLSDIEIKTLTPNTAGSSPSFDMDFTTKVKVKNTNFGAYKYDNSTVTFTYKGATVGHVEIQKGKTGWLTTKNIDGVTVRLNSQALPNTTAAGLGSELSAGVLTLNSNGKMTGKVELIWILKKKKSAQMNCTIAINVQPKTIQSLECK